MDNKRKDPASMVDGWLKDIMNKMDLPQDAEAEQKPGIEADEQAIAAAGLTHPDDMELERIVQETLAESWGETPQGSDSADTSEPTIFFASNEASSQDDGAAAPPDGGDIPSVNEVVLGKLRPSAKKGYGLWGIPHVVSTVVWLMVIVLIGVSLGRTVWVCAKDLLALGKEPTSVSITVEETDNISDIAKKLKQAGLIEYPKLFEMFTKLTGKGETVLRGTITFNETDKPESMIVYDYNALANALSYRSKSRETTDVMIPEGYNCAQIFALLEEKGVCPASALEEYAANGTLDGYWFLDGVQRGHKYSLEGFLFPDTYKFYVNDEPERVLRKFLDAFDYRFTDRMVDKFVALNNKTGLDLTLRDVVIMASIVEKEKASDPEGYSIASVFYNRLTHSGSYPCLQSDATIKYDVDYRSKGQLITDAQINASPYNTYIRRGLPAGPIANPGLSSLDAALDPDDTQYYFFIYDKGAGVHRFSKTLAEHNAWARKLGLG